MPQSFTDQFFLMDPYAPPPPGTALNFVNYTLTDQNLDNDFDRFDNDSVNGSDITASYPGDTVTIAVSGVGTVSYTGITFYLANGQVVFTPSDGQALQNGSLVSATWVNTQGPLTVPQLGPACFTPGTLIAVPGGAVPIETLAAGDLVMTLDHGAQPLRWVGQRTVIGRGPCAPVRFAPGVMGNDRPLLLSQQHRVILSGWQVELLFGTEEVLAAARHLVNGDGVSLAPTGLVGYHHLLFDRHEIVFAEGVASESFRPGEHLENVDAGLLPDSGLWQAEASMAARRLLRGYEASLWCKMALPAAPARSGAWAAAA